MISAPNIDPAVTAITPTAGPPGNPAPPSQPASVKTGGAAGFPAAFEAQQNQCTTAADETTTQSQATIELAAKLAAGAASQATPAIIADSGASPSTPSDAPETLPIAAETATDQPKTGDGLPDDGNVLPSLQDLQALILSLTAGPVATSVTPPAPVQTPAAAATSGASPFAPEDAVTGTDPGARAQAESLRVAIAGLSRQGGEPHTAADEAAVRRAGNSATGTDADSTSRIFLRTSDARPGLFADALSVPGTSSGSAAGGAPGGSPGGGSQFQGQATLFAPALLQANQPTGNDLALFLQGGSAFAAPAHGAGLANPTTVPQTMLPAASDLPALKPLGDPSQWSQSLGNRLLVMADQGLQSATIRLQPEHLGPMEIRIQVDDGNAQVWFSAHHGETRGALQDAIPKLREMFSEQGLTLLQTSVDSGRGSFGDRAVPLAPGMFPERERDAGSLLETNSAARPRTSAWRVLSGSGSRVDLLV